ncbi:MAG TPA: DNA repair protein RecN [Gemmatimonadales bacterium]|nr:DNA repair protein RecN [Gemmatimonadales bacterium]
MLTELRVRDLAVIADVTLPLGPGLNVLTGETGAGKSLLVDALALLLGERASAEAVRPGAARTVIEGEFDLGPADRVDSAFTALGVEIEDGRLILKREVTKEGRSRAWVNGSPATIGVLAQIGTLLVDLHGQHETQSLLRPDAQRDILDAFADARVERAAVGDAYTRWVELDARERTLRDKQEEVRRKADYLRHVVDEITRAAPQLGEDQSLETEAKRLSHAEELARLSREMEDALAASGLPRAAKLLDALERVDASVGRWRELLDGAFANVDELVAAVRSYAAGIDGDPAHLSRIEQRRDVLFRLQQKYGPGIPDVLAARDGAARELDLLDTADLDLRSIAEQRGAAAADLGLASTALSEKRRAGGTTLAAAVNRQLPALGLPGGRFQVSLSPLPSPRRDGAEAVSFLVRLNEGMDAGPLSRIASGGELSRVMLALKVVLARHDAVPTLVFDEVDAGIGGQVANSVGEALRAVARGGGGERQVLVITHLPQIAAFADGHVVVAKGAKGGVATSDVQPVRGELRTREIARMLGSPDMATALRHAEELLKTASPGSAGRSAAPSRPASGRPPLRR